MLSNTYFVIVVVLLQLAQVNTVLALTTTNDATCSRLTNTVPEALSVNENRCLRGYIFHYIEGATLITCGLRYCNFDPFKAFVHKLK